MSLYNYFPRSEAGSSQSLRNELPPQETSGVSSTEYNNIVEILETIPVRRGRTTYKEGQKMRIAKSANMFTLAKAVQHFKDEFPYLSESTIRPWLKSYRENLQKKTPMLAIVLSKKRGRPLYLPTMLDSKLQNF